MTETTEDIRQACIAITEMAQRQPSLDLVLPKVLTDAYMAGNAICPPDGVVD